MATRTLDVETTAPRPTIAVEADRAVPGFGGDHFGEGDFGPPAEETPTAVFYYVSKTASKAL